MNLRESTGYLVNRVAARMKIALERRLAAHDVTAQQWAIMKTLGETEAATVVALAEALEVDVGAASRLIDRLEKKRLVSRKRTKEDARVASVALTESGKKLLPKLVKQAESVLEEFLAPLSNKESEQLDAMLRRMLDGESRGR